MPKYLAVALFFAALAGCSGEKAGQPEKPEAAPEAQAVNAPETVPPSSTPAPEQPFPAERLKQALAEMNALGAPYGVQADIADLQSAAAAKLKNFKRGFRDYEYKDMRLPEPQVVDFTAEEKAHPGPRAKWLEGVAVRYGDALPQDGAGAAEAWLRVIGSRDLSTGDTIFIQGGVPKDKWRRMKWQPLNRRWSYFSEEEELAGMRNLFTTRYMLMNQSVRNSAKFECERMQKLVQKARAEGRDPSGYIANMRGALLRAFDKDLEREALRYYIDTGGKP